MDGAHSPDRVLSLGRLQAALAGFAAERDWDRYHTPKNLVMALAGEVGELTEVFQWLTPEQSARCMSDESTRRAVEEELADVLLYVLRLADRLGVDLERAAWQKLAQNRVKYPVERARGNATKYTEWEQGKGP